MRWAVAAADGHVIEGAFSFTVDAPVPTTVPPTTVPPTTVPPTTVPPTTVAATAAPATTEPTPTTEPSATSAAAAISTAASTSTSVAPPVTAVTPPSGGSDRLSEFLEGSSERSGQLRIRRVGQVVGVVATLIGVGLLGFVVLVLRGRPDGVPGILRPAAIAGLVVAAAAILEAGAHAGAVTGDGLGVLGRPGDVLDALGGTYATAIIGRIAGGLLLAAGLLFGGGGRWRGLVPPPLAAGGAVALVVSHAFDGHTVSKGNRLVQSVADVVHVAAGAVWAGGVIVLAALAWRRWRGAQPAQPASLSAATAPTRPSMLELLLRFSGVAAWALVAVTVAGSLMAMAILDSPGELRDTTWGVTLMFKIVAVAVAAACGGYNRYRLLPALSAAPADSVVRERTRDALIIEAVLLAVVMVLAGVLVGATV